MTDIRSLESAQLDSLAGLLRARNSLDLEIARLIGRPASTGNLGEFIAARIFDIHLAASGVNPGHDGVFASGPMSGKSVNVKMYSQDDALLDVSPHAADYYLVLRGPRPSAATGPRTLPFRIDAVYLFEMVALREWLFAAGVKVGIATSVRRGQWDRAQIYPVLPQSPVKLTSEQVELLELFSATGSVARAHRS
jgi:hypothetical protein